MKSQYLKTHPLPDSPGVYIFRDYKKRPLYIGRATSLKDRVKSYFAIDLIDTRGPRIIDMVTKSKTLDFRITNSVLEAIILESLLIKQYQPFFNVAEKDDKSAQYVIITDEELPRVFLVRARDFELAQKEGKLDYKVKNQFGPFEESFLIKEALRILRRFFPFRDKKAHDPRHESFYRTIGKSPDPNLARQYRKTIKYLCLFFNGESEKVRKLIEIDMRRNARNLDFEAATENRKLLYALNHINDVALIKRNNGVKSKDYRIEAYDISHMSGTKVTGSMAVSINGTVTPSEYRRFKLSRDVNNDLAGLVEILSRRLNHTEWQYPDLIVVDGDHRHKRAAESVLQARRIGVPVVAVTKDKTHKASVLVGDNEIVSKYRFSIIAVNAEAHRFAIKYHRIL